MLSFTSRRSLLGRTGAGGSSEQDRRIASDELPAGIVTNAVESSVALAANQNSIGTDSINLELVVGIREQSGVRPMLRVIEGPAHLDEGRTLIHEAVRKRCVDLDVSRLQTRTILWNIKNLARNSNRVAVNRHHGWGQA